VQHAEALSNSGVPNESANVSCFLDDYCDNFYRFYSFNSFDNESNPRKSTISHRNDRCYL